MAKEEIKKENPAKTRVQSKKQQQTEIAKFNDFHDVGEMLKFAKVLIDSKLVPVSLTSPESVITIITLGKELGFEAVTSLSNIHNIQGKPTLGVHAIAALLKRRGIKYKLTDDYVYIRKDGGIDTIKKEGIEYTDIKTTITFYEKFDENHIEETPFSFYYSEAKKMELLKKDNWKKMPRIMLRNRCLVLGARFVAPEAMLGMYEVSEVADFSDVDIILDEEGNIINDKNN